jgi:crossover junction endodeoxyribonuclease RusA
MTKRIFMPARRGGKSWAAGTAGDQPAQKAKRAPRPRPDPKPVDDIADLPAGPRVIVPFPPVELSPNFRGRWSKRAKVTKNYRRLCWALALEAKLKVPAYAGTDGKIAVRLDFFPPDRNSRDDDNVPASFKAGRDGIADALKCNDARFQTMPVLHAEPRSCVVVTLIAPEGEPA